MDASTAIDRSGQKETLVIARTEVDHVRHALKGLHIVSWMPRVHPEGDHSSVMCAIDIQLPPHAEEIRSGNTRRLKVGKGHLCIQPAADGSEICWVWGVTATGTRLGRPPGK